MRKPMFVAAVAAALLGVAGSAAAAEKQPKYEKKTVINFEDDTIQGDLTRPDGEYMDARKRVNHSNLIKIREEFRDEVLESVGEL